MNIVWAEYLGGYRIRLRFEDDSIQEVDFQPFLLGSLHPEIRAFLDLRAKRKASRKELSRSLAGRGRKFLTSGKDPVAELISERASNKE
jgi:hypothetical protein